MPVSFVRPEILYAWKGPCLLIVNPRGECGDDQPLSGFYFREARFLRTLRLEINGERPWLCETASVDPTSLALTFVHPEITEPGGGGTGQAGDEEGTDAHGLPERSLDVRLVYRVGITDLSIALVVVNRARRPLTCELALDLGADFADIQEAQSGRREQDAPVEVSIHDDRLALSYRHPQLPFHTEIHHEGGWTFRGARAVADVTLAPQQRQELSLRIVPFTDRDETSREVVEQREAALQAWRDRFAIVEVPGNRLFERVLSGNIRDFASFPLLQGERDEWLTMQAGMPLYPAFFGRDAVTAGWQSGLVDGGEALAAALTRLTRLQSNRFDDWRDEQPGRIPYQVRTGPLAILNLNPYSAYYADYASPLMSELSPRHGLGSRAGDNRLRAAALRLRRPGARAGARSLRSGAALSRIPDPGVRGRLCARRAPGARRLSARKHTAALECDRLSAHRADDTRTPAPCCGRDAAPRSCAAGLGSGTDPA